ncbi:MAG: hypothetical protein V3S49_04960 [Thermodesulfobacteriota bacterium]
MLLRDKYINLTEEIAPYAVQEMFNDVDKMLRAFVIEYCDREGENEQIKPLNEQSSLIRETMIFLEFEI